MGIYEAEEAEQSRNDGTIAGLLREFNTAGLPLNTHSNVYESSRRIKTGQGYLFGFTVYSSNVAAQFIQVHDSPTLPGNGAVPCLTLPINTVNYLAAQWLPLGRSFLSGIYLVNSTTGPTLTIGAADCFFDAQFM